MKFLAIEKEICQLNSGAKNNFLTKKLKQFINFNKEI